MRKTNIKSIILMCILAIYTVLSIILKLNMIISSVSLLILGIITFILLGTIKVRNRTKIDTIQIILISIFSYLILIYFLGLLLGFNNNFLSVKNILINMVLIISIEIIRYYLIKNSSNKLFMLIVLILSLVEFSITGNIIGLIPVFTKNILLTYITMKVGPEPSIIYSLIIGLYSYIIPIIPDLGVVTSLILSTVLPIIVMVVLSNLYHKDGTNQNNIRGKRNIIDGLILVILLPIICLIFGIGDYKVLGIVSDSMVPVFKRGSLVVYQKIDDKYYDSIKEGDILVYKKGDTYIVHRVKKKDNNLIITKGDNNDIADFDPVNPSQFVGIVKKNISYIGYPFVYVEELLEK